MRNDSPQNPKPTPQPKSVPSKPRQVPPREDGGSRKHIPPPPPKR
ncbi:hypothetical protein [Flavobacterium luteolum]|nr:hypothetical protein [Flavobacterium luteolum]